MHLLLLLLMLRCADVYTWTVGELALYDLVEEVGGSFYDFYGIGKDATSSEIKKAYRRLSMVWHPDRNSNGNAEQQFQKIAAIYEILKSHDLRKKYDTVLENGLPNWKQPIFYYRRARKLSWLETLLVLITICSVGHYFMLWGVYIDKYLALSSNRNKMRKKEMRQLKRTGADVETLHETEIAEMLFDVWPTWRNSLPILTVLFLYKIIILLPDVTRDLISQCYSGTKNLEEKSNKELPAPRYVATLQPVYDYAVAADMKPVSTCTFTENVEDFTTSQDGVVSNNDVWTREELALLVKLSTEKFPVGTPNRWDSMAKILRRSSQNVIAMVSKLKQLRRDEYEALLCNSQSSEAIHHASQFIESTGINETRDLSSVKSSSCKLSRISGNDKMISVDWSQRDQKLFETALQQFPKGTVDRWDKIVNCVPGKNKQQCIERFKYLSEMVRQRKLQHKNKKK